MMARGSSLHIRQAPFLWRLHSSKVRQRLTHRAEVKASSSLPSAACAPPHPFSLALVPPPLRPVPCSLPHAPRQKLLSKLLLVQTIYPSSFMATGSLLSEGKISKSSKDCSEVPPPLPDSLHLAETCRQAWKLERQE